MLSARWPSEDGFNEHMRHAAAGSLVTNMWRTHARTQVDGAAEKDLSDKYEVTSFPALKWFVNGEHHSDYADDRDL